MTCTEEYREHIEYTFHAFCKVVIRNATINAARTRSRKHKREISLEYLTDEKHYPCFITLTEKYMTPHSYYDIAIEGQPEEQIYYHRSIQDIFNLCFRAGFVIDGFYEECFKNNKEIPMVMIVRLKKVKRDSLK